MLRCYGFFGNSPLHVASFNGNIQTTEYLLSIGADPNSQAHFNYRSTPLMLAAMNGHTEIYARLLAAGAELTSKDKSGRTAWHWARRMGHTELAARLAPPKVVGKRGGGKYKVAPEPPVSLPSAAHAAADEK